jgi:serine/threonine-protein kinase
MPGNDDLTSLTPPPGAERAAGSPPSDPDPSTIDTILPREDPAARTSAELSAALTTSVPSSFDHYEVIRPLGRGGMGEVFLATDSRTTEPIALKAMKRDLVDEPEFRKLFLKEAFDMRQMSHPNIMRVLDICDRASQPYYTMPFQEGGSLATKAKPGVGVSLQRLLPVAIQVTEALEYAHDKKGMIHRDIKPENILLDSQGNAVVCDFGLVRSLLNQTILPPGSKRLLGWTVGTPGYMAPEVVSGNAGDTRVDIYSFGAMLYDMVSGRRPYVGASTEEVLAKIKLGPPPSIREVNPNVPADWGMIIEGCMARELSARYAHMSDVKADLKRIQKGESPLGPFQRAQRAGVVTPGTPADAPRTPASPARGPGPAPRPTAKPASGAGRAIAITASVALLLCAGGFGAYKFATRTPDTSPNKGPGPTATGTVHPDPTVPPDAELVRQLRAAIGDQDETRLKQLAEEINARKSITADVIQDAGIPTAAAQIGDVRILRAVLETRVVGSLWKDALGRTAIHVAASGNTPDHAELLEYLATKLNIALDSRDENDRTPLHYAAGADALPTIAAILKLAAATNPVSTPAILEARDDGRRTPLIEAAAKRNAGALQALITAGADINAADENGRTALHLATLANDIKCVELLLRSGANPAATDNNGKTARDLAAAAFLDNIVELLDRPVPPADRTGK